VHATLEAKHSGSSLQRIAKRSQCSQEHACKSTLCNWRAILRVILLKRAASTAGLRSLYNKTVAFHWAFIGAPQNNVFANDGTGFLQVPETLLLPKASAGVILTVPNRHDCLYSLFIIGSRKAPAPRHRLYNKIRSKSQKAKPRLEPLVSRRSTGILFQHIRSRCTTANGKDGLENATALVNNVPLGWNGIFRKQSVLRSTAATRLGLEAQTIIPAAQWVAAPEASFFLSHAPATLRKR
jgi:hypothetical protein